MVLADASWPAASDHLASRALPGGASWRRSRNSAHEYCSWTRDLSSNKRAASVCRVGPMVDDPRREVFAWDAEIKVAKKEQHSTGVPAAVVLLHILRIPSGSSLFSSSSSAIVTTGAPEPACDSIEMPDGACNARPGAPGPDKGRTAQRSHCLETGADLDPAGFLPLASRSAPVRLFPRFSLAPRRMPPSTGASGLGRSSACPSHLSVTDGFRSTASLPVRRATHVVLCTYDPISSPLLLLRRTA